MLCIYMSTLSHAVNYRADLVGRVYCSLDSGIARWALKGLASFQSFVCGSLPAWGTLGHDLPSLGLSLCICEMWEALPLEPVLRPGEGVKLCPGGVEATVWAP